MLKIDREKISPAQSQLRCFVLPRFHPRPIHPLFFVVCVDFALSFHSLSLPVFSVVLLSLASPFAAAAVLALVLVLPTSDTCLQQLANTTRSKHVYIAVAVVASCLSPRFNLYSSLSYVPTAPLTFSLCSFVRVCCAGEGLAHNNAVR